jgi:hypothetical protein
VAAAASTLFITDKGPILIVRHQILKDRTIAELAEDLIATILMYTYVETEKLRSKLTKPHIVLARMHKYKWIGESKSLKKGDCAASRGGCD